jgi:hypothetical protein
MTKLRIDFQSGILEVEGEESFVKTVYQDYKDKFSLEPVKHKVTPQELPLKSVEVDSENTQKKASQKKIRGRAARESFLIVKDLDLSSNGGKKSLRDFYKEKAPSVAMENNAVFVYYLQKIAGVRNITSSHVYSCYKNVEARVPTALRQSLLDTSHRKGWIDTASMEDIKIATPGENYVEQDLPKPDKAK